MSFYDEYLQYSDAGMEAVFQYTTSTDIERIIGKDRLTPKDFLALLSPKAEKYLEEMAQKANQLTVQNFGRVILLYTPMYLSDYCTNKCTYCGFNVTNAFTRKQLTMEEVEKEAQMVAATGIQHILILTGDAPAIAGVPYMKECVTILKRYFSSIAIEVYAMKEEEYAQLMEAGVESMTMYQETYNPLLYDRLHVKGPKKDYRYRLDAPERACRAGMRAVNIGALLGLDDWRRDGFFTGLHAHYLQSKYPGVEVSISLPRIRPTMGNCETGNSVNDTSIVQFMTAFRLFMPRAGMPLSTRENAEFRNHAIKLGITKMSAGVQTAVGGHIDSQENPGQFAVSDTRNVKEMSDAILHLGYQPVFKDWQAI
ncbi:2-iminoacetate synthase ThiH [Pelosinus propionicus]|uniref:Tyrosine lyase ThiH n=1 Tax=Pelosinus propionicus DSM 13327 TaxID=1123291 RepID=A0A1I4PY59_9FIRM|nr:2-iminoacetate synthase ThiH [Pelosinus propionicus]SFM32380.1 tyrosine lyase ThiH [Pelosinus propionicus DSM 13327]